MKEEGVVSVTMDGFGEIGGFRPRPGALYAVCPQGDGSRSVECSIAIAEGFGLEWATVPFGDLDRPGSVKSKVDEAVLGGFRGAIVVIPNFSTGHGEGKHDDGDIMRGLVRVQEELSATAPIKLVAIPDAKLLRLVRSVGMPVITDCQLAGEVAKIDIPAEALDAWIDGIEGALEEMSSPKEAKINQKGGK